MTPPQMKPHRSDHLAAAGNYAMTFEIGQPVVARFPNISGAVVRNGVVTKISATGQVTVDLGSAGRVRFNKHGDEIGGNIYWTGSIKAARA